MNLIEQYIQNCEEAMQFTGEIIRTGFIMAIPPATIILAGITLIGGILCGIDKIKEKIKKRKDSNEKKHER